MMVREHVGAPVLALAVAAGAVPATAHSFDEVEGDLHDRERYFQPIDRPAPDFALRDAAGQRVDFADLRGEVVVLHFIYTSCPDVCPLHAEKIAEIQAMVNRTPMKEQVRFVTITTDPARDTQAVIQDYGPAHGLDFEPTNLLVYLNALVNRAQAPHPHAGQGLWERLRGLLGS